MATRTKSIHGNTGTEPKLLALRALGFPAPGVGTHFIDLFGGPPPQRLMSQFGIGPASRNVARPTGHNIVRHRPTAGRLERAHHLQYRIALARAQVYRQ